MTAIICGPICSLNRSDVRILIPPGKNHFHDTFRFNRERSLSAEVHHHSYLPLHRHPAACHCLWLAERRKHKGKDGWARVWGLFSCHSCHFIFSSWSSVFDFQRQMFRRPLLARALEGWSMPYLPGHHLSFHWPLRRWPSSSAVRTEFCLIGLRRTRDR